MCKHTCVYNGVLFSHQNEIMPFATIWMDLEIIILSKSMSERQIPYVSYMWSLKYDTNQHIYKTKTDS